MDMDFCLGEKIPTLYKDAATGAALRQLESTMKETDGNHWFACVQEVSSHKRSWEEETASHWDKRAPGAVGQDPEAERAEHEPVRAGGQHHGGRLPLAQAKHRAAWGLPGTVRASGLTP